MEMRKVINLLLLTLQVFDAESKTEFANNSLNLPKTGKLFLGGNLGPMQVLLIHKKQSLKISCYCPFKYKLLIQLYKKNLNYACAGTEGSKTKNRFIFYQKSSPLATECTGPRRINKGQSSRNVPFSHRKGRGGASPELVSIEDALLLFHLLFLCSVYSMLWPYSGFLVVKPTFPIIPGYTAHSYKSRDIYRTLRK